MTRTATPLAIAAALGVVYVVWGATYLGIAWAIESMPPLLMGGARWLIAGSALFLFSRLRSGERPTTANWRATAIVGALLVVGGNGSVNVAEQWVASGLTALIIASVPLWLVVFEWMRGGARPALLTAAGVAVGLTGVALLVGPGGLAGPTDPRGAILLVIATISWAFGSIWSRSLPLPRDLLLGASMQMLAGGVLMTLLGFASPAWMPVVGLGAGETLPALATVTAKSWAAFAFLIVFGSIVAYSAYVWLLQVAPAAKVGTYAFVNPLVAVLLGWALNDEVVGVGTFLAGGLILAAVAILLWQRARGATRKTAAADAG